MDQEQKLRRTAYRLSMFTIVYNLVEGVISMILGYADETLTLFGFGIDSFIEVMSGIGIAVMIFNIRKYPEDSKRRFEVKALKVTGTAFYLLSAGLLTGIIVNILNGHKPESTLWGIVISVISIGVMVWLMMAKLRVGRLLNSGPIISDANCTKICIYMSVVLLLSSFIYEVTDFPYTDMIGAAGLIYFSIREGREAFSKAKGTGTCCD